MWLYRIRARNEVLGQAAYRRCRSVEDVLLERRIAQVERPGDLFEVLPPPCASAQHIEALRLRGCRLVPKAAEPELHKGAA